MRTRLTDLLEVEHPVMLAGMGGVAYAELVAAVSEAGGFGCLGAATMTAEQMVQEMQSVKARTARPFGVDVLTAMPGDLLGQVDLIIDGGSRLLVAGLGVPTDAVQRCHERGVLVASLCGKAAHAVRAVQAGCDLVIAQGTEAGGHTGLVATMALVPAIVDAVGDAVPVVAAGGIADGRGLAAALCLGAAGVWVGTRFIATPEARAVAGFKDSLLRVGEDGTTITRAYTGKPMRVVANDYTARWEQRAAEIEAFPDQILRSIGAGAFHLGGDVETAGIEPREECFPAGQGLGLIHDLTPAGDLVREMVGGAESVLRRINDRLPAPA